MNATSKPVRLSVLDQSPIIHGHTPAQAVQHTVELAREVEALGFHRMWLAEHHGMRGLADPCPEILLTRVAAATERMRVGTGGVMLPYYSALKVAEQFRMLEALFPGRIDLGMGRAPGSDMVTSQALFQGAFYDINQFPVHVQETVAFLDDALPGDHPYARVKAMPAGNTSPEVWLLGSSDYGATLASMLGLRCSFAHFINARGGDEVMRAYRRDYRPSVREPAPYSMLTVFAICGRTVEEAERLAAPIDLRRLQMARGFDAPIATVEMAINQPYTDADRLIIERERARAIIGTPDVVRDRILALQAAYEADEVMVLTITGDYRSRIESYAMLAEAFGSSRMSTRIDRTTKT
ncbi:MAG: LLM class flavin-dependent oxidoreductase [Burkholderiales bacterium]|nr:LLM class flavin-dependent oxidoreductase [Burkholderiales bacterium]